MFSRAASLIQPTSIAFDENYETRRWCCGIRSEEIRETVNEKEINLAIFFLSHEKIRVGSAVRNKLISKITCIV